MASKPDERPRIDVVFIGGTGRSGSTVIEHHLASRLGASAIGETVYLWDRGIENDHLCECGETFSRCEFWTNVMRDARMAELHSDALRAMWEGRWHRLRAIPALVLRGRREAALDTAARAWGDLLAAVAGVSGSKVIVESSKDPAFWLFLDLVPNIRVHTVHVVRDSRAVAWSWKRRVVRPELADKRVEYMGTLSYWKSALKWLAVNLVFASIRGRAHSGSFTTVRYEDFARAPDRCLSYVQERLEAKGVTVAKSGSSGDPRVHHSVSGNPVRFAPDRLSRISLDEEWRSSMPLRAQALVVLLTLPLLAVFGYVGRQRQSAKAGRDDVARWEQRN